MSMENTKQVKIFVAVSNVTTFVENMNQKGTWNRKRNKINLEVATTFGAENKNRIHLWGNINTFSWRKETQRQMRQIFKVSLSKLRKKKQLESKKDFSGETIAVSPEVTCS